NLSQDHLDYHASMEDYLLAKATLFTPDLSDLGVVNVDAEPGRRVAEMARVPVVTFGLEPGADVVATDLTVGPDGVAFRAGGGLGAGRLIVVFGCGGDRDRARRPLMGQAATSLADLAILTSDNPRSEGPAAVVADIVPGARAGGGPFVVEVDRRAAIGLALREAAPGDVVVVAGKGHETGQEFADRTIPFDDRVVATEELAALGRGAGPAGREQP